MSASSSKPSSADFLAGGACIAVGAFFLWGALHIETQPGVLGGPHVVPTAASLALLLLGALILLTALTAPAATAAPAKATPFVFAIVGVGLAYVWAIGAIGYLPATFAVAPAAFFAFGGRGFKGALLPGTVTACAIYLIFFQGLGAYDPPGQLLSWRDLIGG
ncbi:MAG: tripartite tricarboxylate transporter TctB family protein [Pseudomonadota bacterium]